MPFLQQLYASIREQELALTNFSREEKEWFIQNQFQTQHQYYCSHYNTESFDIVYFCDEKAGRFFVDYWDHEIRVVDIALMPKFRNRGIASYLLECLFNKADTTGRKVSIHVERHNKAKQLYERLGFKQKSEADDIYLLMERAVEACP
ncbi:N-acetyltransferase [Pleionea sp. CnH1-48]|uniref:GNAT family N-acetyltransferase n=1 Tax=Pleionea sp. CnH1-48 TaxID=2954494 RepID=UPI0020975E11|nr:GNAT family N-acetyltransferase [Pleionea sp. CnH1-48]MCO7227298.1 GNAT family N-acetyltransferase [Pleionea sp. CnH1-48]